ncbi:MAG: hypothetical protein V3V61_01115 [Gammaproteobacteria bacterium]
MTIKEFDLNRAYYAGVKDGVEMIIDIINGDYEFVTTFKDGKGTCKMKYFKNNLVAEDDNQSS